MSFAQTIINSIFSAFPRISLGLMMVATLLGVFDMSERQFSKLAVLQPVAANYGNDLFVRRTREEEAAGHYEVYRTVKRTAPVTGKI